MTYSMGDIAESFGSASPGGYVQTSWPLGDIKLRYACAKPSGSISITDLDGPLPNVGKNNMGYALSDFVPGKVQLYNSGANAGQQGAEIPLPSQLEYNGLVDPFDTCMYLKVLGGSSSAAIFAASAFYTKRLSIAIRFYYNFQSSIPENLSSPAQGFSLVLVENQDDFGVGASSVPFSEKIRNITMDRNVLYYTKVITGLDPTKPFKSFSFQLNNGGWGVNSQQMELHVSGSGVQRV